MSPPPFCGHKCETQAQVMALYIHVPWHSLDFIDEIPLTKHFHTFVFTVKYILMYSIFSSVFLMLIDLQIMLVLFLASNKFSIMPHNHCCISVDSGVIIPRGVKVIHCAHLYWTQQTVIHGFTLLYLHTMEYSASVTYLFSSTKVLFLSPGDDLSVDITLNISSLLFNLFQYLYVHLSVDSTLFLSRMKYVLFSAIWTPAWFSWCLDDFCAVWSTWLHLKFYLCIVN